MATIARTASVAGVDQTAGSGATGRFVYNAVDIGVAAVDRTVAICFTCENLETLTGAKYDQGGGEIAMSAGTPGAQSNLQCQIFYANIPAGTTAKFIVEFAIFDSYVASQNWLSVYRLTGAAFSSSGMDVSSDMDATNPLTSGSRTIPSGGVMLAVAACGTDTVAKTWANLTEDLDLDAGVDRHTTAFSTTAGTATRTCTGGTNAEPGAMSWMIFSDVVPWTGTLASVSAMNASLGWVINGLMASTSAMSADLSKPWNGSGAFASVSSMSGHFEKTMPLSGNMDALSAFSGEFIRALYLSAENPPKINVVSTMHADVLLTGLSQMDGSIPSLSAMSGDMVVDRPLTSILESVSAMSANLGVGLAGGVSGGLAVGRKVVKNLIVGAGPVTAAYVGSVLVWPIGFGRMRMDSISEMAADMLVDRPLAGRMDSISVFVGDVDTGFKNLSGTLASLSELAANLVGTVGLSGSFAAGSDASADLIRARKLSGAVDTISDSRADLASNPVVSFSGVMATTSSMGGDLEFAPDFQEISALRVSQSEAHANITIPSGVQEGDILVWHNAGFKDGSDPTDPTPSGWTKALTVLGVAFWSRYSVFVRIAPAGYGGTVVEGIVADVHDSTLNVFRNSTPITSFIVVDPEQQITNANPSSQTKPVFDTPIVYMGFYSGALDTIVRTFTPAAEGELETSDGGRGVWTKWKCYNITALSTTIDGNDVGSDNVLMSFGIRPEAHDIQAVEDAAEYQEGSNQMIVPLEINEGDLIIWYNEASNADTPSNWPADVTPTGWTKITTTVGEEEWRLSVFAKIAEFADAGSSFTGLTGSVSNTHLVQAFRDLNAGAIAGFVASDVQTQSTGNNPTAQVKDAVAANIPSLAIGISFASSATDFSLLPSSQGPISSPDDRMQMRWRAFNGPAPVTMTADMGDTGARNSLLSFILTLQY